jgi:glycosidase
MAASTLQYTVYGFPSLYYGDEAGLEGLFDPFCRRPYPWGREDNDLLSHYKTLGKMRKHPAFARGEFDVLYAEGPLLIFERRSDGKAVTVAVNVSEGEVALPFILKGRSLLDGEKVSLSALGGYGFAVVSKENERKAK